MSDTTPTTSSASASCCKSSGGSCCTGNASTCPCADRLAKVERTVCRIRLWLFVALGVLVLLIGIALGRGGAMKEMQERGRARQDGPRAAAPLPPGMQAWPGPGPREDRGPRGRARGGDRDD
ncbi:MAG: hypothetical protein FGM37_03215 [Phycisphaerales bacterium]|nr:hypothetical protein [Phycisphaerales bacterium]